MTSGMGSGGGTNKYRRYCRGDAMDEYLARLGLVRKPIAQDPSSLFRAVSEQIYFTQRWHSTVRHHIDRHIAMFPDKYNHLDLFDAQLLAISNVYQRDVIIYRQLGQSPVTANCNRFANKVFLCESRGGHYDGVYNRQQYDKMGICQSLAYEMLYKSMGFEPDQLDNAVGLMRSSPPQHTHSHHNYNQQHNRTNRFNNYNQNNNERSKYRARGSNRMRKFSTDSSAPDTSGSNGKSHDHRNATTNSNNNLDRPPFPYRTCKALDPSLYRNIEFDVWQEIRKEQYNRNQRDLRQRFAPGTACLVRFEPGGATYHAVIEELRKYNRARVLVTQLNETREVHLKYVQTVQEHWMSQQQEHAMATDGVLQPQIDTTTPTQHNQGKSSFVRRNLFGRPSISGSVGSNNSTTATPSQTRQHHVPIPQQGSHFSDSNMHNCMQEQACVDGGNQNGDAKQEPLLKTDQQQHSIEHYESRHHYDAINGNSETMSWQDSDVPLSLATMVQMYSDSTPMQPQRCLPTVTPIYHSPASSPVILIPHPNATPLHLHATPPTHGSSPIGGAHFLPSHLTNSPPTPHHLMQHSPPQQQSINHHCSPTAMFAHHSANNSWLEQGNLPMLFAGYTSSSPGHSSGYYAEYTSSGDIVDMNSKQHVRLPTTHVGGTTNNTENANDDAMRTGNTDAEYKDNEHLNTISGAAASNTVQSMSITAPMHQVAVPPSLAHHHHQMSTAAQPVPILPPMPPPSYAFANAPTTMPIMPVGNEHHHPSPVLTSTDHHRHHAIIVPQANFMVGGGTPVPMPHHHATMPSWHHQHLQHHHTTASTHSSTPPSADSNSPPLVNSISVPFFDQTMCGHVNFGAQPSRDTSGIDLPMQDLFTLRYFYNLGCEYFRKLMHADNHAPQMMLSGVGTLPQSFTQPPPSFGGTTTGETSMITTVGRMVESLELH